MPPIQASASVTGRAVGPPRHRARSAPTMTVIGLILAKACSHPGMVATGTRVELVKVRMMTGNRPARPAVSASRTTIPSSRLSQEKATPAATARLTAASAAALAGFCGWVGQQDPLARVLVRECLMGTPGLYPWVIGAEWPLTGELEAIIIDGMQNGELRSDVPADLLALAIAGMTDLA